MIKIMLLKHLYIYLFDADVENKCDHTFKRTRTLLKQYCQHAESVQAIIKALRKHGIMCDCQVLENWALAKEIVLKVNWKTELHTCITPSEQIRTIRHDTGMSQTKFAEHLGISECALKTWERGLCKPPQGMVQLIERVIDYEKKASADYNRSYSCVQSVDKKNPALKWAFPPPFD